MSRSYAIATNWKDGHLVHCAAGSTGAGPQAEIATTETLVAAFEDGFETSVAEWDVTTGQMSKGSSTASANVHDGALVVIGEIAPGLPFPWAGGIWMPSEQPMQPVDSSDREAIHSCNRSDGRQ